jgi:hypothetical protein
MLTYKKVRWAMFVLAIGLPLLAAMFGVHVKPLDEVGGGGEI